MNEYCDQGSAVEYENKDVVAKCATEKELGDLYESYSPYSESGSKNIIIELNILTSIFEAYVKCKMYYFYGLSVNVNNKNAGLAQQFEL